MNGSNDPRSRNGHILVVDDESFIREAIELYFATEGYDVKVAANGEEALQILEHADIDAAILDIVMPGMNGIDVLREIKKSHPGVEVIMASGGGEANDLFRRYENEVQLLLIDISMPEMDGRELLRKLQPLPEHTRVVLTTGFDAEHVDVRPGAGEAAVLHKPYDLATLQRLLTRVDAQ